MMCLRVVETALFLSLLLLLTLMSLLPSVLRCSLGVCILDLGNCMCDLHDKAQLCSIWCHYKIWDSLWSNICLMKFSTDQCLAFLLCTYFGLKCAEPSLCHIWIFLNQHFISDSPCTQRGTQVICPTQCNQKGASSSRLQLGITVWFTVQYKIIKSYRDFSTLYVYL